MKGLVFDLDKKGLETVFKPYQSKAMELLYEKGTLTSGEAHRNLRHMISRASIIIFFNYLVDENLLKYTEELGKGGAHRVYRPAHEDYTAFLNAVFCKIEDHLHSEFLGVILGLSTPDPDDTGV